MRLRKYLTEDNVGSFDEITSILEKDCIEYLTEAGNTILWRGTDKNTGDIAKIKARKDRYPLSTPKEIHDELNKQFKKKFGWDVRNGVFTYGDYQKSRAYGIPKMFFPIGHYRYVWSPEIGDLYGLFYEYKIFFDELVSTKEKIYNNYKLQTQIKIRDKILDPNYVVMDYYEWLKTGKEDAFKLCERVVDKYKDNNLYMGIKLKTNEISFDCDEYYLVHKEFESMISKFLIKMSMKTLIK